MTKRISTPAKLAGLFAVLIAAIVLAQALLSRAQIDVTQDRLYTLSNGSRTVLENIRQPITLTLYFSQTAAAGVPALSIYVRRVEDLLASIARASKGRVKIIVERPTPFSAKEDLALTAGLREVPGPTGESIFFGLIANTDGPGRKTISFLNPADEGRLEYDIISLISQLSLRARPKIAVYTTLPMPFGPGGSLAMLQGTSQPYAVYQQLRTKYAITLLDPGFTAIADDISMLLVAHPGTLTPGQLRSIDRYVNRGGRLLLFIDPFAESAALARPAEMGQVQPNIAASSNLPELLTAWGVRMLPDRVVADGKWARRIAMPDRAEAIYFLPWLSIPRDGMAAGDLALSGLSAINLGTAGALELLPRDGVSATALLSSSDLGGEFPAQEFQGDIDPQTLIAQFRPTGRSYVLAARLTGKLPSAYDLPPGQETAVVVVADTDLLSDHVWMQPAPGDAQVQLTADNGSFVLNLVDQLSGDTALIALRGREPKSRAFTILADTQVAAENQLRREQSRLSASLRQTQQRIAQLELRNGTATSPAQAAEVANFRRNVVETRRKLRETQAALRQSAEGLSRVVIAVNVLAVPLLIALFAAVRSWRRRRRTTAASG